MAEPTFSGIVGLTANAMGRTREQDISDLTALTMGVRTEIAPQVYRDFYTAGNGAMYEGGIGRVEETRTPTGRRIFRVRDSGKATMGTKDYLTGSTFLIGLTGDQQVLEAVQQALWAPARPLYAGRRSCPVSPVPLGIVEAELHDALANAQVPTGSDAQMVLSLPASITDPLADLLYDVPVDFSGRDYLPRAVRRSLMTTPVGPQA